MTIFAEIDAAAKFVPNLEAWKHCPLRGAKIGERECKTCRGRVRFTVFACPHHPEGVTLEEHGLCATCAIASARMSAPPQKALGPALIIVNGGLGDAVMVTPCALAVRSLGYDVTIWPMRGNATRLTPLWKLIGIRAVEKAEIAGQAFDVILGPTASSVLAERAKAFKSDRIVAPRSHAGQPVEVAMDMARQLGYEGPTNAVPFADLLPKGRTRDAIVLGAGVGPREENQLKKWAGWPALVKRLDAPVFCIGDAAAAEPWMNEAPCQNLIGRTENLADLIPIFTRAKCYVGVDNGVGHLAAAFGIPTMTVFVATDPAKFRPYGPRSSVISAMAGPDAVFAAIESRSTPEGLSLVITALNEGSQVRRTIESVRAASENPPEAIVVDDGSEPPVSARDDLPAGTIVIRNDGEHGVAPARNIGCGRASRDVLFFLDAHMRTLDGVPDRLAETARRLDCIAVAVCTPLGRPTDKFGYGAHVELHEGHIRSRWNGAKPGKPEWPVTAFVAPGWAVRRETFVNRMGGWIRGLAGWGHTEQTASAKAFFCGVPIILRADCTVEHMFRNRFPYRISPSRTWLNAYLLCRVLFDEATYRHYWKPALQKYHWSSVFDVTLESDAVHDEYADFQKRKTRTDGQFFGYILGVADPSQPMTFADAPWPLVNGPRAVTLRKTLELLAQRAPQPQILEIGSLRSMDPKSNDGAATVGFAWFAHKRAGHLITVDCDPAASVLVREHTAPWRRIVEVVTKSALEFKAEVKHRVDLLYLDAWDHRQEEREGCHLAVMKNWEAFLTRNALVLIDDIGGQPASGKGAKVVPYLLAKGWHLVFHEGRQCLLSRI